jgi:arginase
MAQKVRIIGVPMDLGQSRRGVDMGPSALRGAGLQASIKKLGLQVEDIGNLSVKQPEEMPVGEKRAKYLQEIAETCGDVAAAAEKSLGEGFLPLVLGGDHSIAAGVAAGVANYFRKDKKQIGYLWLDAHGDMNTPESSPSGNVHGMPLAAIMGYGAPELVDLLGFKPKAEPGNIVIVGARDLDAQERKIAKSCPTPSSTPWTTPPGSPSASIWISSIPPTLPASALPSAAASPTAKLTSLWK